MKENILDLKNKIENSILNYYIKLPNNKFTNVGILFEKKLGLESNSFSVADINGIELKVLKKDSIFPITLFNCTCDGPNFFELNRLVNSFGVLDYTYNTKILYIDLYCNKYSSWGKNLKMKLQIDYKKEMIYIIVAHSNGKIIEKRAYWNFSTLEQLLNRKLKVVCLCSYVIRYANNSRYCKFCNYEFIQFINFEKFLNSLENGYIFVGIKYGIYKRGPKEGKSYNHGTAFRIKKNALFEIFEHFE